MLSQTTVGGRSVAREVALGKSSDAATHLYRAVDRSVSERTTKLAAIAEGPPSFCVSVLLAEWDLSNLLTIFTGLAHATPPGEIVSATLGGGTLGPDQIAALASSHSVKEAYDRLLTWGYPEAGAVKAALRGKEPGHVMELRLGLTRHFYASLAARTCLCAHPLVADYLGTRIDMVNLLTSVQWRSLPADRDPTEFFLAGGREFTIRHFHRFLKSQDLAAAASSIHGRTLRPLLTAALDAYEVHERASVMSQVFERELFRHFDRPINHNPLDISLVLAYLLKLRREGMRLKLSITRLLLGLPPEMFREMVSNV